MQIRKRMPTCTLPFLALAMSFGVAMTAVTVAGCSSTDTATANPQSGGTGSSSTPAGDAGGAANSSTASSGGATSSSGTGGTTATGPGVWATLNVNLIAATASAEAYASIEGFGKDAAPLPDTFKSTATSGACRLLEPTYYLCANPKCSSTETCTGDDKCTRTPDAVSMGQLVFSGLTLKSAAGDLTVDPVNKSYTDSSLAYPPCTAGKDISVSGGADADTKFSVKAQCIDPIEITGANPLPFKPGEPTQITWKPPTTAGASTRMMVRIDISHHGGLKGLIVCDTPDTGSVSVDGELAKKLVALGTAGFPIAKLTRVSSASALAGSGTATLSIQSGLERDLEIPGVVSCTTEKPCATGVCKSYKCEPG